MRCVLKLGPDSPDTDLIAGYIDVAVASIAAVAPFHRSGRVRAIVVAGPERSPSLPDVMSAPESGMPGLQVVGWYAVVAPTGTPSEIVVQLNSEINKVLLAADVRERLASAGLTLAQAYPVKPVRVLVGFSPGGGVDFMARSVSPRLAQALGQPFVIDNRSGANGMIAADIAAKSPADGYRLLMAPGNYAFASALEKLPLDMKTAFSGVAQLVDSPLLVVVHPSLPVKNLRSLIALANPHGDGCRRRSVAYEQSRGAVSGVQGSGVAGRLPAGGNEGEQLPLCGWRWHALHRRGGEF